MMLACENLLRNVRSTAGGELKNFGSRLFELYLVCLLIIINLLCALYGHVIFLC